MTAKEHANTLGIFFWIFAGLQFVLMLFWIFVSVFLSLTLWNFAQENPAVSYDAGQFVSTVVMLFIVLFLGTFATVAYMAAGYGFRKGRRWVRVWGFLGSVAAFSSVLVGGMLLFPFGLALGIYCLWFLYSEEGKHFPGQSAVPVYYPQPQVNWQ